MSRANAISAFYLFSYLGTGIPVVLAGLLSLLVTTIDSSVYSAVLLAPIIITAFATVALNFGKSPPGPTSRPRAGQR